MYRNEVPSSEIHYTYLDQINNLLNHQPLLNHGNEFKMKKSIIFLLAAAMCSFANATVRTVSNNPNSPGQYTDLTVAITASAPGDTLYIHGSPTDYGTITINKPLTLIGAGGLPNKNYSFSTYIGYVTLGLNGTGTSSGSGTKIYGLKIYSLTLNAGNNTSVAGISDVILSRNYITYLAMNQSPTSAALAHNNINVFNNVIYYISSSGGIKNSVVRNNILYTVASVGSEIVGSWILNNNIILYNVTSSRSAVVSNNIFINNVNASGFSSNSYCSVSNNCFVSSAFNYNLSDVIYGTNSGGNNLLNTDPLFVTFNPLIDLFSYSQTAPAAGPFHDFHLMAGSPCLAYGTDGTDTGVYGGAFPFHEGYPANTRYRYFPMPAIPQMLDLNINNAAIVPTGTLNVQFKARKND